MRFGIVSDIHANLEALDVVLGEIDAAKVDALLCLGDIVGYGPNPNECCDRLRERNCIAIAGNHDEAAVSGAGNAKHSACERWNSPPACATVPA